MNKPDRVALIDADILVYESAYRSQSAIEWDPGEFTTQASMPEAQAGFESCVESILKKTGSSRAILALSDHRREANFRRAVWPGYKAGREAKLGTGRPMLYSALREWIRGKFDVRQKPGIEADDTLGILMTGKINGLPPVDKRVLCSIDKDLDTVPGLHFNWRKAEQGVYLVEPRAAFRNLMVQTLVGDKTDNYPGIPGIGPKRADTILEPLGKFYADRGADYAGYAWELVVEAYEKAGLTAEDALIQARCARILQAEDWDFETNTVRLWEPPTEAA